MSKINLTRSLYKIATQSKKGIDHQIDMLLKLGIKTFDLEIAILSKIDGDRYEVLRQIAPGEMELKNGNIYTTGKTFCVETLKADGPIAHLHIADSDLKSHPAYTNLKLESYVGVPIKVSGKTFGTLNFSSPYPKERKFRKDEIDALKLMSIWISAELERNNHLAELEKTYQELKDSQQYFESVFESIGNSIVIVDEKSEIIMMNKITETYFGYSRDEILGQKIEMLVPPRYRSSHKKLRADYNKHPENRGMGMGRELLAMKKDGSEFYVEIGLNPIKIEKGRFIIVTLIDISKRRALEEERDDLFLELKNALDKVKSLKGMLPICMSCKKVRDDKGYWEKVESYIMKHSDAEITHGLCPDCAENLYPDFYKGKDKK